MTYRPEAQAPGGCNPPALAPRAGDFDLHLVPGHGEGRQVGVLGDEKPLGLGGDDREQAKEQSREPEGHERPSVTGKRDKGSGDVGAKGAGL